MTQSRQAAHFGRRALAWILDLMLLAALWLPLLYVLNTFVAAILESPLSWHVYGLLRALLVIVVSVIALAWATARFGGSPGKQLMELQVIDATNGQQLRMRQALIRIPLSLASMFSLVGVLMMLFDDQRRTYHDWLLKSRVIEQAYDYADESLPAGGHGSEY